MRRTLLLLAPALLFACTGPEAMHEDDSTSTEAGIRARGRAPALRLLSPRDGTEILEGEALRFFGAVADDDGAENVRIIIESDRVGFVASGRPKIRGFFDIRVADISPGSHIFKITALDGDGKRRSLERGVTILSADQWDQDGDGFLAGDDCNDSNADINPSATEICNGADDDCDGEIDGAEVEGAGTWYADFDGDGFGDVRAAKISCNFFGDLVADATDCDDTDAAVHPDADEVCDGFDNNCNDSTDDDDDTLVLADIPTRYFDADGDGYGTDRTAFKACRAVGFPTAGGDCDDRDASISPGATEICDDIDNDCDGAADDADNSVDLSTAPRWFADSDGDGVGTTSLLSAACVRTDGSLTVGDCDDNDAAVYPGAVEICDDKDNDCDRYTDDNDDDLDLSTATTEFPDRDEDGFGAAERLACWHRYPTAEVGGDCDDDEAAINPAAADICDSIDNDCDGSADDADDAPDYSAEATRYLDADEDGFGAAEFTRCVYEVSVAEIAGDCDDDNADIKPGATEICDSIDNDCDGDTDDDDAGVDYTAEPTLYADADGDTFGEIGSEFKACAPSDFATIDGDCNDGDAAIKPGATEICDSIDNDCDGDTDDDDAGVDLTGQPTVFFDDDGDGHGDAAATGVFCAPSSDWAASAGDCDDNDADIFPGNPDVCGDAKDNDCDGYADADDWADGGLPYRATITVTAAGGDVAGEPVFTEVDFGGLLSSVGDADGLATDSIRLAYFDCASGTHTEIPSQWEDGFVAAFNKAESTDAADEFGTFAFIYDTDGDLETTETLASGDSADFTVYFGSTTTSGDYEAPEYTTDLETDTDLMFNSQSIYGFAPSAGGLLSSAGVLDGGTIFSHAGGVSGNGIFASGWLTAGQDTSPTTTWAAEGPIFASYRAEGNRTNGAGGIDYAYTYTLIAGQPQLYAKTWIAASGTTTIGTQNPDFTAAIRPFQGFSNYFRYSPGTRTADPGHSWMHLEDSDQTFGLGLGYLAAPAYMTSTYSVNQHVFFAGNDYAAPGGPTSQAVADGTVLVDNAIMTIYPHPGSYADNSSDFFGAMQIDAGSALGAAEAYTN